MFSQWRKQQYKLLIRGQLSLETFPSNIAEEVILVVWERAVLVT